MKYIDIHSHLNFDQYDDDRSDVIQEMKENDISTITVGTDLTTSRESIELAADHEHIWATVGIHPTDAVDELPEMEFRQLVKEGEPVAIGECGFDYYRTSHRSDIHKLQQRKVFEMQIEAAIEHDLPLMLHCRPQEGTMDAYQDTLEVLESYNGDHGEDLRGNVHFFVGNDRIARRFLNLGFTLSFTGIVTFVRSFDDVIQSTPQDMIMVETDAPFAAPEPHRGERNSPLYIDSITKQVAEIRDENKSELRAAIYENARRIFDLA